MRFDRDTFGPYLRHARERRSISLDDIAARTKIARALLAKLERGDVADWPPGIFRRSFFREYASAIGLDADALLTEFLRLFPDPAAEDAAPPPAVDLRLTLEEERRAPRVTRASMRRALVDIGVIVAIAAALSVVTGHAAMVLAVVAVLYHAIATASAATMAPRRSVVTAKPQPVPRTRAELPPAPRNRRRVQVRGRAVEPGVVRNVPQPS